MAGGRERRRHHRRKVDLAVEYRRGEGPLWSARLQSMSIGGCFIETDDPLPFGTPLSLSFRLPSSATDTEVSAVVRWSGPEGMGVQFGALRAMDMYRLTAFLADKPPQSLRPPLAMKSSRPADPPAGAAEEPTLVERPDARIRMHRDDLAAIQKELDRQTDQLQGYPDAATRVQELEQKLEQRDEQLDQLRAGLRERDERMAGLRRQLAELRLQLKRGEEGSRELAAMVGKLTEQLADQRDELAQGAERIRELEAAAQRQEAELAEARRAAVPTDDLTLIKGIGPKFARALEAQGISRFEQIAAWTSSDLAEAARHLKITPRRIERAGWVASAAALLAERGSRDTVP